MIKNFDASINGLNGQPIKDENGDSIILKSLTINALEGNFEDERNLLGEEKDKRGLLADKIFAGGEIDVTPEEIVLIKQLIGKAFPTLLVTRAYQLLDA